VAIDIGANIGEVSILFRDYLGISKVIAIEPEDIEFRCLRLNFPEGILVNSALWKEETFLNFYTDNGAGDSSFLPRDTSVNSHRIKASTLDLVARTLGLQQIDVIKLEAEGAEPEVVLGGLDTLKITRFITADLGPERGPKQESTAYEVSKVLESEGFRVIATSRSPRHIHLFVNERFFGNSN
jgi:FkbM family methyltransferase